ncbi:MAG TPA: DMT family transporter [Xanthobacteraceae bacterium]|jgi:drug/metabolite transporter (DMT)-like permease
MSAIDAATRSRTWIGVIVALSAAACFSLANTAASIAEGGGSSPLTISAIRFLVPAVALVVWLHLSGVSLVMPWRGALVSIGLGIVSALYTWALLKSFGLIPFALSVLIFYLFPLIAAVIVAAFGFEKFSWRTGAAIIVALVGLALALKVHEGGLEPEGLVLAVFAALGIAIVIVVSSRVFGSGDARPTTMYMAASASALMFIICAVSGDFALPQSGAAWLGFLASTAIYAFAMIAFYIAISMIGPVLSSILSYADAVISACLGVVVLDQALTPVQIAGIALVILALVGATIQR